MEQFSLEKYLENPQRKVVTRYGRPVRIICWDRKTTYWKIVGLVTSPDGSTENPFTYDVNGNESDGCLHDHKNDLFFADEEEWPEFEKTMIQFSHERNSLIQFEHTTEEINAHLYRYSEKLLDLARKEILKDLPKLEKTKDVIDPTIPVMYTNAASMKTYVEYNGYKLCINDVFEKLPKEE